MEKWDPEQYTRFEKERTQPSINLISRLDIEPASVLDIGCGPGNSTEQLARRFPKADILGADNSGSMLERAMKTHPELTFRKCSVPDDLDRLGSFGLVFSNACLHWIPHHETLLPRLMDSVAPGGALAVQVPLTQKAEFYRVLHELVKSGRWARLGGIYNFHGLSPEETYDILTGCSSEITMWETTYYHVVPSQEAVIEWYRGSGLKPYLDALGEKDRKVFLEELLAAVRERFPVQADGNVILRMPRLFYIARK